MVGEGRSGGRGGPRIPARVADAGLLVLLALGVYGPLLRPGAVPWSKHSDLVQYAWPVKQLLYDALHGGGGLPFWRVDQLGGNPALLDPQSLHLFPLHFLYALLPPLAATGPTFWLELLLGAVGAYVLGAALGVGRGPRLVMGAAQLCAFKLLLLIYAGWVPVFPAVCLLPWFAAALVHVARAPDTRAVVGLAAVSGLAFQAGAPQLYYYAALLAAPALLVRAVRRGREAGAGRGLGVLAAVAAGAVLGFGLAADLWLPLLADLHLLSRGQVDLGFFLGNHRLGTEILRTLLAPEALGTPRLDSYPRIELWEDVLYFGWAPSALALVGAVRGRPRGLALYLAGAVVASLALVLDTPLVRACFHLLPAFSWFRIPSRIGFVTGVAVIALAGLGAEAVRAPLAALHRRAPALALALVLTWIAGEGAVRARQYVEMRPAAELSPPLPLADVVEASPYRTLGVGRFFLSYAWTQALGLQLVNGYNPYGYAHYRRFLGEMATGEPAAAWPGSQVEIARVERFDMLDALGVRYLIAEDALDLPEGWTLRRAWVRHPAFVFYRGLVTRSLHLYERDAPRARAALVDAVVTVPDADAAARRIADVDLRRTAVVESANPVGNAVSPGDALSDLEVAPGAVGFRARLAAPRFVQIAEVWHPGWSARVDGRAVPLLRSDLALLGLELPAGEHSVELRFRPPYARLGLATSAVALLVWLGLLALRRRGPDGP